MSLNSALAKREPTIEIDRDTLRTCLFYEFRLGEKETVAHRRLCQAFGEGVVSEKTCFNWFNRFKSGDYNMDDKPRSGRPPELDDKALRQLVEADPRLTARELGVIFGCSHSAIEHHLSVIGKVSKLGSWIPHALTPKDLDQRSDTCALLLSRRRRFDWLDNVITGDEKWVMYVNHT